MRSAHPSGTVRYLVAIMLSALAVFLVWQLTPGIIHGTFVLLYFAVALSAWYGGMGPALLTMVLCAVAHVSLVEALWGAGAKLALLRMTLYIVTAMTLSALALALRAAQRRVADAKQRNRSMVEALRAARAELEARVAERTKRLSAANTRLQVEIGERIRTEAALRQSEQRFVSAFQHAPVGMVLTTPDARPFRVNRAFCDMLGYSEEELVVRSIADITHPDDIEAGKEALRRLTAGEVPSIVLEKRYLHKLGHIVWGVVSVSLLRDRDGQPLHFVSQVNDITERRRAEEALSEGRNFVSSVLDILGAAVVVLDMSGRIVRVNRSAEAYTGYTFAEAQGLHFWELLSDPVEVRRAKALFARQLTGDWPTEYEATWIARDGRPHALAVSTSVLRRQGLPEYFVATSVDITARKQAEQDARQREAELAHVLRVTTLGEMASGLAHEINQPLSAIVSFAKGCVNRLQGGDGGSPELLDTLDQIAAQSLRAGEIIRRLRRFVSKAPPRREAADINGMVRDVAQLVEAEARQDGIVLQLDLAEPLPPVEVDGIQIEQVLVNLVRNGLEAMQQEGESRRQLTIRTGLTDDGVEVAVSDTGRGLPAANGHSVFDPFFTTKPNGLGMGLSISRTIIAAHGGELCAIPAMGRGAIFRFCLPTSSLDPKEGACDR